MSGSDRTATSAIRGYLYQFHQSVSEILSANDDVVITLEGPIEDIDIAGEAGISAIQCKYHESASSFQQSALFKPVALMFAHYVSNTTAVAEYIIHAHFPSQTVGTTTPVGAILEATLASKDKAIAAILEKTKRTDALKREFIAKTSIRFGPSLAALEADNTARLCAALDKQEDEVAIVHYPNCFKKVLELSVNAEPEARKVTRQELLQAASHVDILLSSVWRDRLRSTEQLVRAQQKRLTPSLNANIRAREFWVTKHAVVSYPTSIVDLVADITSKYAWKLGLHRHPPTFVVDLDEDGFADMDNQLRSRDLAPNNGFVNPKTFSVDAFAAAPLMDSKTKQRNFDLRLIQAEPHPREALTALQRRDAFVLGTVVPEPLRNDPQLEVTLIPWTDPADVRAVLRIDK